MSAVPIPGSNNNNKERRGVNLGGYRKSSFNDTSSEEEKEKVGSPVSIGMTKRRQTSNTSNTTQAATNPGWQTVKVDSQSSASSVEEGKSGTSKTRGKIDMPPNSPPTAPRTSSTRRSTRPPVPEARDDDATTSSNSYFESEIKRNRKEETNQSRSPKTVEIRKEQEPVAAICQILLEDCDSFFSNVSFDKKSVPSKLKRAIKILTPSLEKEWILCGLLSWEEHEKFEEITQGGSIKKSTNPYVVAEYFLSLCRELYPVISYDDFAPSLSYSDLGDDKSKQQEYLNSLIKKQPKVNKATLCSIIQFLALALKHSATNKMQVDQVASLYGPFLLTPSDLHYRETPPNPLTHHLEL